MSSLKKDRLSDGARRLAVLLCCGATQALAQAPAMPSAPEEDIRGPRGLIEIPQPEQTSYAMWWVALAVLIVVPLLVWGYRVWRSRTVAAIPRERALEQLRGLSERGEGHSATLFAEQAADILRCYFTDRFGLAAPRRTTEEFLRELVAQPGAWSERIDHLREFLRACDLAKFAAQSLDHDARKQLLAQAAEVVTATDAVVAQPTSKEVIA